MKGKAPPFSASRFAGRGRLILEAARGAPGRPGCEFASPSVVRPNRSHRAPRLRCQQRPDQRPGAIPICADRMVRIRRMSGVQMSLLCIPADHCDWDKIAASLFR